MTLTQRVTQALAPDVFMAAHRAAVQETEESGDTADYLAVIRVCVLAALAPVLADLERDLADLPRLRANTDALVEALAHGRGGVLKMWEQ